MELVRLQTALSVRARPSLNRGSVVPQLWTPVTGHAWTFLKTSFDDNVEKDADISKDVSKHH